MRKVKISIITFVFLAVAISAMAQSKVVVDPNIKRLPSSTASESSTSSDKRLAQKTTYTGGYKRLHAVISDLSKASGVHLYCGKNSQDWQVQDIPVIIYVKDMPLGRLLRAVADGTHTQFTLQKVNNTEDKENESGYRICRNKKSVDSIVASMEDRYYAKFADAEWGWDALVSFGKDSSLDSSQIGPWAQGFSKVLTFLGDDAKRKVFSGQSVVVNTETSPQIADALRLLYKQHMPANCTADDLVKSEMRIDLSAAGDSGLLYLIGNWTYHYKNGMSTGSGYPIPRCANALKNVKDFNLASRPPSELPKPEEDYPKDRLHILSTPKDWELPILKTKINLEAPHDNEHPTFSDAVIAIAKASGFNIVCEDFQSQQNTELNPLAKDFFVGDITLGEALKKLYCYKSKWLNNESGDYDPTWLINEEDKLIVGWANDWREHHYYLVPESLIANLTEKMNGNGAQLDDIVPLVNLTHRQLWEWIRYAQDIWPADFCSLANDNSGEYSAWKLYAALSDSDKALVKGDAGLPLGKFDSAWLLSFFQNIKTLEVSYSLPDEKKKQAKVDVQLKKEFLTDPKLISTLTMQLPYDWVEHNINMIGEKNGQKVLLSFPGPYRSFPVYSPKREKELHK